MKLKHKWELRLFRAKEMITYHQVNYSLSFLQKRFLNILKAFKTTLNAKEIIYSPKLRDDFANLF